MERSRIFNQIGFAYLIRGEYQAAIQYFHEALSIEERILGKKHPNYARSLNNIGSVFIKMGKYEEALNYH